MRIEVKGRNLQVTDELREYVARRFDKIAKQVSELAVLEVEVCDERTPGNPARWPRRPSTSRARRCAPRTARTDTKHAINLVAEDMARQVKRHRDKRRGRRESPGGRRRGPRQRPAPSPRRRPLPAV